MSVPTATRQPAVAKDVHTKSRLSQRANSRQTLTPHTVCHDGYRALISLGILGHSGSSIREQS